MALLPTEGAEPIPGYRLLERLGTGGYGEVWKTTAPGGLTKAVKLVYGHMQDVRAEQELKSLSRIRDVRHPFLLSLERFEIVEGQLVIVTELADMSMMDLFEKCRKNGLRGIPRDELLVCMRDAADALDYMTDQFGLQHLDIKPQNLLLVGGRIKVADFGLVKNLQGSSVTATGGVTPIYASPEAFDGRVSKYSDQYSLAIVYQEMLTGVRPFPGTTPLQLAMQHTHSPPVLDPLPTQERPILARALAKVPEQRFASCRAMVESLQAVSGSGIRRTTKAGASPPTPSPRAEVATVVRLPEPEELMTRTTSVGSTPPVLESTSVRSECPPAAAAEFEAEEELPPRDWAETMLDSAAGTAGRGLRPMLYVGLGGLACAAVRRLRERLQDRFGSLATVPILRTLLVDTDRTAFRQVQEDSDSVAPNSSEMLLLPLRKPEQYRSQARDLLRWLDRRWLYGIPRSLQTEGMRPLGRLALLDNANEVLTRLRVVLSEIADPEALNASVSATGLGLRSELPRVFLVASVSGGTGGGILVDVAYAIRQVLRELQLPDDTVCGILLHATCQKPTGKELARVNAYATLTELNHFNQPGTAYSGDLRYGFKAFRAGETPFTEGYFLHLGDDLSESEAEQSTDQVAEFLYQNTVTEAGAYFEEDRGATLAPSGPSRLQLRTFGMSRITLPRYRLADSAGSRFCHAMVTRWRGEFNTPEDERQALEAFRAGAAGVLEVDAVASHLYTAAGTIWREEPKVYLRKLLEEAFWGASLQQGDARLREVCNQALGEIAQRLGGGRATVVVETPSRTAFEMSLHDHAVELADKLGRSVIDWLVGLIEDPRRRLIKAADQAARWFVQHLFTTSETLAADLNRLRAHREVVRSRLAAGDLPAPEPAGKGWFGLRAKPEPLDPVPHFLDYGLLRLREIALENTLEVLQRVHGQVTAFTQDVARSLEKLRHFAELFSLEYPAGAEMPSTTPPNAGAAALATEAIPNVLELLPENAKNHVRAAESLFNKISPRSMEQFDEALQTEVFNPLGGLWHIVAGPRDLDVVLKDVLRKRARAALLESLQETDAAGLFLAAQENSVHLAADLKLHTEAAAPRLAVPAEALHLVALLPGSGGGAVLRELLQEVVPPPRVTILESEGDVVLCRESQPLSPAALAAAVTGSRSANLEAVQKVLTRGDVNWMALKPSENLTAAGVR